LSISARGRWSPPGPFSRRRRPVGPATDRRGGTRARKEDGRFLDLRSGPFGREDFHVRDARTGGGSCRARDKTGRPAPGGGQVRVPLVSPRAAHTQAFAREGAVSRAVCAGGFERADDHDDQGPSAGQASDEQHHPSTPRRDGHAVLAGAIGGPGRRRRLLPSTGRRYRAGEAGKGGVGSTGGAAAPGRSSF